MIVPWGVIDPRPLGAALSGERMDEVERSLLRVLGFSGKSFVRHARHLSEEGETV